MLVRYAGEITNLIYHLYSPKYQIEHITTTTLALKPRKCTHMIICICWMKRRKKREYQNDLLPIIDQFLSSKFSNEWEFSNFQTLK